jgi:exopolysaccharide biosynthesis polyprenyl glycosylphosphotransferase
MVSSGEVKSNEGNDMTQYKEAGDATAFTNCATGNSHPGGVSHVDTQTGRGGDAFFDGSYFSMNEKSSPDDTTPYMVHRLWEYSIPRWSYIYVTALVALDMAMSAAATGLTFAVRPGAYASVLEGGTFGNGIATMFLFIALSWVVSLASCHIYERHTMGEGYALYSKIFSAIFVDFVLLCAIGYAFKFGIPRTLTFFVPPLTGVFTVLERYAMRKLLHHYRRGNRCSYPTVVVGSPEKIHSILRQLSANTAVGYVPIAVCPVIADKEQQPSSGPQHLIPVPFKPVDGREALLRVLPMNSHLPQTVRYLGAQTVLVADTLNRHSETMRTLSLAIESMGLELAFTSTVADVSGAALHLREDPSMPVLTAHLPQYSVLTRILKRAFDIVLSTLALVVASPLMAYIALRVKAEDGGPAIYSQQRIGLYGKPFTMYKFRSMCVDADAHKQQLARQYGLENRFIFKIRDDPRVTRIGHFIRKNSLDEFPQFFNVLRGDMSLVGPRPPLPEEVRLYNALYSTRLLVKPGITGPWQISGRSDLTQEESEHLDVSYVEHWSLTSDMAILLKTVMAVIRGTGSY